MQWHPFRKPTFSLVLGYDIGFNVKQQKEAFTLNPSLPGKTTWMEKLRTNALTVGINIDIRLLRIDTGKQVFLSIMPLAAGFRHTIVSFENENKENYTVLNQDVSNHVSGLVMAFALKYLAGNKFFSINVQTPLLAG